MNLISLSVIVFIVSPLLYTTICIIFSLLTGEYNKVNRNIMFKQLKHSITSMLKFAPINLIIQLLISNGHIVNLYTNITDYGYLYLLYQVPLYIILSDTIMYWTHRILHIKSLYFLHNGHHVYHPITSFAAGAVDVTDTLFHGLPSTIIPFYILPFYEPLFTFILLFIQIWSIYIHSPLAYSINIPFMSNNNIHYYHHQTSRHNYGIYTTIWDKLCGTYYNDN
ncbi:Fatty acid hydroxylase (C-5 sterol desaturase putative) [Orpheovirus IHUMI-LCC2]|uniref:Fatty acid hydroxylase (C-5 sterol desaturase putative) n=1 Tax=Orpheovirus IHUMI-LCC2 TaxID=2023057 RepID=A0A2I2L561_9VIRU|nr:Fatty acid hydroxylase (C-5 sterol desaturase putative) [Orpheovirus IHUMI-LCC2]SNW62651.1 Fatty acid hydroxylase (C-5 sterol desaturase putative) [Orpheovirus IHUMI-LCC2]